MQGFILAYPEWQQHHFHKSLEIQTQMSSLCKLSSQFLVLIYMVVLSEFMNAKRTAMIHKWTYCL